MGTMQRRTFLKHSGAAVALAATAGVMPKVSANDRVVMALIGCGARGRDHGRMLAQRDDVFLKYVCDPDMKHRIGRFPEQIGRIQGQAPIALQDFRTMLDDQEVDAVLIATCDHWHGLATVLACQAGFDVYIEKPASHNIWEGRKMIEAARKYDRVVHVGTQNRSAPYIHAARQYIEDGKLGNVHLVKVFNVKAGMDFRQGDIEPVPEGVDYDVYLGPAPKVAFRMGRFHGGWKRYWAYGGGDMADDGFHQLDIGRYLIGDPAAPTAVSRHPAAAIASRTTAKCPIPRWQPSSTTTYYSPSTSPCGRAT